MKVECEYRAKIAGTRTHLLVAVGAALMMVVSRIWVAAVIGMAVAVGMYAIGIATTVISLVGLEAFGWLFSKRKAKNSALKKEGKR